MQEKVEKKQEKKQKQQVKILNIGFTLVLLLSRVQLSATP